MIYIYIYIYSMQQSKFYYVGMLMAMSLLQDGCGFRFLAPPAYQYVCGADLNNIVVSTDDVADFEVKAFIEQVYLLYKLYRVCSTCI